VAVALALWREGRHLFGMYFWILTAVFAFALVDNVIERPDGAIIASIFIAIMLAVSAVSRYFRSTELRISDVIFENDESAAIWKKIQGKKINLVPLRTNSSKLRDRKAAEIHEHYKPRGPLGFIHVRLLDNRSEFLAPIKVRAWQEQKNYVIEVHALSPLPTPSRTSVSSLIPSVFSSG